jgi:endonuclease YncB( thermonuclease family)
MVESGFALAYRRFGTDYIEYEADAHKARAGMWSGTFLAPWVWRRTRPES